MPKRVLPLAEMQVRNAKPREEPYKLFDGGGLYLEVTPSGGKLWRFKFQRQNGREGKLAFCQYPDVSLDMARERRAAARRQVAEGVDPVEAREAARRAARDDATDTFEAVAREWHDTMREQWQPQTAHNILHRLETDSCGRSRPASARQGNRQIVQSFQRSLSAEKKALLVCFCWKLVVRSRSSRLAKKPLRAARASSHFAGG